MDYGWGGGVANFTAIPEGSLVHVSIAVDTSHSREITFNWDMYLQRKNGSIWETLGTRTGYTSGDDANSSPSNRTFTDIEQYGEQRVYVNIKQDMDNYIVGHVVMGSWNY